MLRALWRSDRLATFPAIPYPIDVHFAQQGLAIYDFGEKRLHVVDAATGRERFAVGRRGYGPGEFGDRPVELLGGLSRMYAVEFSDGRVTTLVGEKLQSLRVSKEGRWATGCTWGSEQLLFQTSGHEKYDNFVTTMGEDARIVDSVAAPWPRHHALPFIVRQAQLRQIDDSTCALLPLYHREFAIISPTAEPKVGLHIEELPEAKAEESRTATTGSSGIGKGARSGAVDARTWRDYLLVLFEGTAINRLRTIDVYDRRTLMYRGSTLLPFEASRLAV
ncbi:MAG: hypothetical protein Q8K82_22555, partial [Gemmatimonadaceae bacterium]|nr:hypothetical protein [Gemmatimonadaceae bacterium]